MNVRVKKHGLIFGLIILIAALAGCKSSTHGAATATGLDDRFSDIPAEARAATGIGDPRSPGYWALWNSCAPENRAEAAEANGGRAAGWFLMDDLLANPGIEIGDLPVLTCEQGLALLERRSVDGETGDDPVYLLASQLLAAELNLTLGAESCPVSEEAVVDAHIILLNLGFTGSGDYAANLSAEQLDSVNRVIDYLIGYNLGELCIN